MKHVCYIKKYINNNNVSRRCLCRTPPDRTRIKKKKIAEQFENDNSESRGYNEKKSCERIGGGKRARGRKLDDQI